MKRSVQETASDFVGRQLDRVQVVLCGTTHSGNLGVVARAMKNMGLSRLVLVAPQAELDEQALSTAKHAADILHAARIEPDLNAALGDSVAVWATSARKRELQLPLFDARTAAQSICSDLARDGGVISILFGAERTGLTNQELASAQRLIEIPANPTYPVLNLGQAVQIVSYELFMAGLLGDGHAATVAGDVDEDPDWASMAELSAFETRLADALDRTAFFVRGAESAEEIAQNRQRLLSRVQILFRRARPTRNELAILHGMIRALAIEPSSLKNSRQAS